uniref:AT25568p n=1 Tax=Drosophila melanogaster TaxID=7227 RepID=Q8T3Y4_DROME|nr:AT25568p [Drosophila melanogaster]
MFPDSDRIDGDKSTGILRHIATMDVHRYELFVVKSSHILRRLSGDGTAIAWGQFHGDLPGDPLLGQLDTFTGINCLGTEPEAIVHVVGHAIPENLLGAEYFAVQSKHLEVLVGSKEDGASRRLVHPPGLQSHKAIFHDVNPPNAI